MHWYALGGNLSSGPSVSSWAQDRLDVFARGQSGDLVHKWFDNGWSDWESLGGNITSVPAAVSWGQGRIDVFARGESGDLVHKWYDNGWSDWESLGGYLTHTSGPGVSSWNSGRLDVFIRGGNDQLHHKWYDNGWSDWESLGGLLTADPSAVSDKNGRIHIFSRNTNNQLSHLWFEDSWREWESLGGSLSSGPSVCSWAQDRLDVFVRGVNGQMYQKWFQGGWNDWVSFGGQITSAPAAVSWGQGRIDVFARGSDNQLIQKWYDGTWRPPETIEKPGQKQKVRVTINGFHAITQTRDHAFNVDGWGDEVYLSTLVTVFGPDGEERLPPIERTSAVMGDVKGFAPDARVRAGTANTATGGIKSGNSIPTNTPWARSGPLQEKMVPMTVFEGELREDETLIVIPTIWEWDNGTSDAYAQTVDLLKDNMDEIAASAVAIAGPGAAPYILVGKTVVNLASALKPIVGEAGDRPIGMGQDGEFSPKAYAFNSEKAKRRAEEDHGLGNGVFEVNYRDTGGGRDGAYTLYLQMELV